MDAEFDYDTTNLQALREELKVMNTAALDAGLISRRDGWPLTPRAQRASPKVAPGRAAPSKSAAKGSKTAAKAKADTAASKDLSPETGKAGARRLLAMAARTEGDGSPAVPGTDFTEAGVVRLLAHLRKRHSRGFRFLQRMHQFLTRPVQAGIQTSAGISAERLQTVARQLLDIEANGWHQFRDRVERRSKPSVTDADQPAPTVRRARAERKAKPTRGTAAMPKKPAAKSPPKRAKKTAESL